MDIEESFAELEVFLDKQFPTEETRRELMRKLLKGHKANKEVYLERWLPHVQESNGWLSEPLCHVHLLGMNDPTMFSTSIELTEYRDVIPVGPLSLRIGGHRRYDEKPEPEGWMYRSLETDLKDVVGLCIDRPQWSVDDGQGGNGGGDMDIMKVLNSVMECIAPHFSHLRLVKLRTSPSTAFNHTLPNPTKWHPGHVAKLNQAHIVSRIIGEHLLTSFSLAADLPTSELCWFNSKPWWTTLEHLSLSRNRLTKGALKKLFKKTMTELTSLDLSQNKKFGPDGVEALLASPKFPMVEHLDLRGCNAPETTATSFMESPNFPLLKSVLV